MLRDHSLLSAWGSVTLSGVQEILQCQGLNLRLLHIKGHLQQSSGAVKFLVFFFVCVCVLPYLFFID